MKTFPAPKSRNWNVLTSWVKCTASAIDFWLLFLIVVVCYLCSTVDVPPNVKNFKNFT